MEKDKEKEEQLNKRVSGGRDNLILANMKDNNKDNKNSSTTKQPAAPSNPAAKTENVCYNSFFDYSTYYFFLFIFLSSYVSIFKLIFILYRRKRNLHTASMLSN